MIKLKRYLIAVLAALIATMSFVLIGCTDDDERTLDDIESVVIVGTWSSASLTLEFRADGTCMWTNANDEGHLYEFRHTGSGNDQDRGQYEIIQIDTPVQHKLAFFLSQPSGLKLCFFDVYGRIEGYDDSSTLTRIS